MSKQQQKRGPGRQVRLPHVGLVQLAPARESDTPFCAYYGPNGETCSQTVGLKTVWRLPGPPTCAYMACPLHYEVVYQQMQAFLARLVSCSRRASIF